MSPFFADEVSVSVEPSSSKDMVLVEKIWSKEVFATTRLLESADRNGRLKECVTAVGGVSSV
jgi:hypothetical protein